MFQMTKWPASAYFSDSPSFDVSGFDWVLYTAYFLKYKTQK